jgi:hypothetical protein
MAILNRDGLSLLLVEQNATAALAIADRAWCSKPAACASRAAPPNYATTPSSKRTPRAHEKRVSLSCRVRSARPGDPQDP